MPPGRIKFFLPDKSFGFITADAGGDVYFRGIDWPGSVEYDEQTQRMTMPFDASVDAPRQFEAEMRARPSVSILCPSRPSNIPRGKVFVDEACSL
jgi:hypothetical protein